MGVCHQVDRPVNAVLADSHNVSVSGDEKGEIPITLGNDMASASYVVAGSTDTTSLNLTVASRLAGSFTIETRDAAGLAQNTNFGFVVFGELA